MSAVVKPKACGCDFLCDCLERRDCDRAGELGHVGCGPCLVDPEVPRFMCGHAGCREVAR